MTISIKNLSFKAILGILDFERNNPQSIEIDCEIKYSYKKEESDFIDYIEAASFIETTMKSEKFFLIEDAIERLFQLLKVKFPQIKSIKLTISKPNVMPNCRVSVSNYCSFV